VTGTAAAQQLTGLHGLGAVTRKSATTVNVYASGVRRFLARCQEAGVAPELDQVTVAAHIAELLDRGAEANTAAVRQLALRRFAAWLVEEGELDANPLAGLRPVMVDRKVVPVLTDKQLRKLVATCHGKSLRDRRDEALVRLLAETGLRAGEAVALEVSAVDLTLGTLLVVRGKGGKGRLVPFGPQTASALDRYLRARRQHPLADTSALWLGDRGRRFTYNALYRTLVRRAELLGFKGFHPQVLRHTAAHRWRAAGGSEGGLMAVAGWSRRDLLDRNASATASERAAAEAKRLNLGDLSLEPTEQVIRGDGT
jgi:site-specific recombinase XerD